MRLYIIRHGETEWNTERRMQGQTDIPLNENGISLAKKVGANIKDIPLDFIISSPLKRARVTAELVRGERNIPIQTDERLAEMSFGDWEGRRISNEAEVPLAFHKQFHEDPLHCQMPPNAESFQDVIERTKLFYMDLCKNKVYENANILISTHGAAGRCFMCNFFKDETDLWRGCIPKNCSICIVDVENGQGNVVEMDKLYI